MHGFEILIPIIAVGAPFGVAIIAMMTKHQQRMAELMHMRPQFNADPRIDALQRDMADLKDLVHQQTIALDRLSALPRGTEVQERIGG
jgi:hypothetical protein